MYFEKVNSDLSSSHISDLVNEVTNHTFPMCVLGEAHSGKSTFINKLVGQDILTTDGTNVSGCRWVVTLGPGLVEGSEA